MKTIAIDIDDVISSSYESFIDYHNKHFGTELTYESVFTPSEYWGYWQRTLNKVVGISEHEAQERFVQFLHDDAHINGQRIYADAKRALLRLGKSYSLHVVTARDLYMQDKTIEWLHSQLPDILDGIHFIAKTNKAKADVCKDINAEYLIDDFVEHCNIAGEAGIRALLFGEYGWNVNQKINKNVTRVKSWKEVIDYFNKPLDITNHKLYN